MEAARERPSASLLISVAFLLVSLVPAAAVMEVPTPILVVVAGFLGLVVLALRPDVATLLVVGIVYSNAAVVAVRFHNVPFTIAAGSVFLLVVPLGYYLLVRREPLIIPRAMPWIIGYLLVQLLSTMLSANSPSAAGALGIFVTEGLLLYMMVVNAVRTERMVVSIVVVLLVVGAILGAITLHQEFTQNLSNDYLGFAQRGGDPTGLLPGEAFRSRPSGPHDGPNRYAQTLVLLLPLVFAVVWGKYSRRVTVLAIGAGILMSIGVALTLSRGAAVGFALVLALMFAIRYIRLRNLALVAVAVVALFFVVPQYGTRLQSLDTVPGVAGAGVEADGAIRSRITEMIAAALVFADHPIIGVGPDQFQTYYLDYADDFGLRVKQDEREAHNLYVGIASDSGILGSIFFFGAIAVTIRDLRRTRSRLLHVRPRLAHLAAGFMLALVGYLTTGIFLHLAIERYLWLMMALGAAVSVIGLQYGTDSDEDREATAEGTTEPTTGAPRASTIATT
jgi:hypothetical protein